MLRLKHLLLLVLFSVCLFNLSSAQTPVTTDETKQQTRQLTYLDSIILGVVEGITEYLPISSTGHLILVNHWLGLNASDDASAADKKFERAVNAYAIIIQAGAIAAVIFLYWRRLLRIIRGFLGHDWQGFRLGRNIIIAFIPAALLVSKI